MKKLFSNIDDGSKELFLQLNYVLIPMLFLSYLYDEVFNIKNIFFSLLYAFIGSPLIILFYYFCIVKFWEHFFEFVYDCFYWIRKKSKALFKTDKKTNEPVKETQNYIPNVKHNKLYNK